MNTASKLHFDMLKKVVSKLTPSLREKIVFVGGCTTCLFVDDVSQEDIRSTEDVDLIISVLTHGEYRHFQEELKSCGFKELGLEDEEGPICRMKLENILIDLMPTNAILGFENKWYPIAFETAENYQLDDFIIKLIHPIYFLATKFEAYNNRGNGDILESKDIEDILIVINGRPQIYEELFEFKSKFKDNKVIEFIQEQFKILKNEAFFLYKLDEYSRVEDKIIKILEL